MSWIAYPLSTLVDLAVREYVYVEIVSVMPDRWYMWVILFRLLLGARGDSNGSYPLTSQCCILPHFICLQAMPSLHNYNLLLNGVLLLKTIVNTQFLKHVVFMRNDQLFTPFKEIVEDIFPLPSCFQPVQDACRHQKIRIHISGADFMIFKSSIHNTWKQLVIKCPRCGAL